MKEAFSKSIERRNDPPSHDHGVSTALHNSHHVHAMVPMPKLAHQPYVSHFLLAHKTYLHSAFHYQLIGQSLYVSKITYDLRTRKTQFYHGDRVYGPTAQKILLALQVDSCTPEAMIQLTCFMSTWRPLYVSTLLSNAYITSTYKCRPGNWREICQALLHSNKPKRWHVCREIN